MPASKPARQCALVFPSGKRCGSPALRNQRFCHFHAASHRDLTRNRFVCERLDRIGQKLNAMSASELLDFLHQKLGAMTKTMTRFPEVSYILTYTLDRLAEITMLESEIYAFLQQNQEFTSTLYAKHNESNNLPATPLDSII